MSSPLVQIQSLSVRFNQRPILQDLSLILPAPGLYALMGPGGVGKSTLLRTLAGLTTAHPYMHVHGHILIRGLPRQDHDLTQVALVEQRVRPFMAPLRELLLEACPTRAMMTRQQQDERCAQALSELQLEPLIQHLAQPFLSLPLFMQRAALIAHALLHDPTLLCVDEPTASLEDEQAQPLLDLLARQRQRRAILWIEHHQARVRRFADTTLLIAAGRVWSSAPTEDFFARPPDPLTRRYVETGGYELSWPTQEDMIAPEAAAPAPPASPAASASQDALVRPLATPPVLAAPPPTPASDSPQGDAQALASAAPPEAMSLHKRDDLAVRALFPESVAHYPRSSVGPVGFHWLIPGRLAGAPRPGIVMDTALDLAALRRVGITRLITLTEAPLVDPALDAFTFDQTHLPIIDMEPPSMDQALAFYTQLDQWLHDPRERLLVHCKAGLGRTGTILVGALVWRGMAAPDALALARRIHHGWVQSDAQLHFLLAFDDHLRKRRPSLGAAR